MVFKEVVPIADRSVVAKIHQSYRLGYVKARPAAPRRAALLHAALCHAVLRCAAPRRAAL